MPCSIALVANWSFAFSFTVVFSSVVVLSFSFSCLSVSSSVAFSCIPSFAHVLSFTFSFVAFPCHSNVHWLWTIAAVRVCIVHHLQLAECVVALLYSTTMLLISAYVVTCPARSCRCCCNAPFVSFSRIAIFTVSIR